MLKFAVLLLAGVLSGCAVPPAAVESTYARVPFDEAEYSRLPKTGTGVIKGQAFLKTKGGDVKTAAGELVSLYPSTSYSDQAFLKGFQQKIKPDVKADLREAPYVRFTKADAQGRFEFAELPPGKYYVYTFVTWSAPSRYGLLPQGGQLADSVTSQNGKTIEVILTR